jgi:hypothetical protein
MDRLRHNGYLFQSGGSAPVVEPPSSGIVKSAVTTSYKSVSTEAASVIEGRISLVALNSIILAMVVFYIWTRGVQGGG